EAREELSPSKIWSLPEVIQQTKKLLGIEERTGANDAIEEKRRDIAWDEMWHDLAIAAIQIGVQIVAAEFTAGASLGVRAVATAAAFGVSAESVSEEWKKYQFQKAMSGEVSLNPAVRLSQEEPSFTGLAFDIAFMVLDFHTAVSTFHHLLAP